MVLEICHELIFGYETFRERQIHESYSEEYKRMAILTNQTNIIYFYIKKDGTVAYRCWQGEHQETHVSPQRISLVREIIASEEQKIDRFVRYACWQGMPINFVFENTGYGIRATDMQELSRTNDKFKIKPVFEMIFAALYPEIPDLAYTEKYPVDFDFFASH